MSPPTPQPRILIFSKTSDYRHTSIPTSLAALHTLATNSNLAPTTTEDASIFTPSTLAPFAAIILLQNTGPFLSPPQLAALQSFVRAGGGIVGIHAATAGMLDSPWYGRLLGAHFASHPEPEAGVVVPCAGASGHVILDGWEGRRAAWVDEWYVFETDPWANPELRVLLRREAGEGDGGHPVAWWQVFEGARVFYLALGHFDEAWGDAWFLGMVRRGILWAAREVDDVCGDGDGI